ncbi:MAG: hypothetical protein AAGJ82_06460 [Bacteroidota bacterium]
MKNNPNPRTTLARLWRYLRGQADGLNDDLLEKTQTRDMLQELQSHPEAHGQIEADLRDIRQRWYADHGATRSPLWSWVTVAAGLLFLVYAGFQYQQSNLGNRLFADQLAAADQDYLSVRGSSETSPEFQSALDAYANQRYEHSLLQFQALRATNPYDGQILLYTALSALQLGQDGTAEATLNQLLALDVSLKERTDAQWYLALLAVKKEQFPTARTYLQWIVDNTEGARKAQAEQLLRELPE